MSAAREQMSALMRDMLAIQTAIELKIIDPPPEDAMMPIRRDTASTASNLLDEFEASLLINRVRSIIIRDVRDELRKRSRFGKFLQYSAGAMTIALAVEISAISFLFTDPVNLGALKISFWIAAAVTVTVACAYIYLSIND
jgi:hypothetical protein